MALSPRVSSLINDSLAIEYEDAKSAGALGYMARALVQATLPHTDPHSSCFERTTGLLTLSIVNRPAVGIPYGSIPRLLLAWVCTEAVRTHNPDLMLGRSQAEFLRKLEIPNNGRDIARLKDQAHRLFSSLISMTGKVGLDLGVENMVIAKRAMLFWNPREPEQQSVWESSLTLSSDFFSEVTNAPVPVDLRVLHSLSKSPFAMDIYVWLTYRIFLLHAKGRPEVLIPWEGLQGQFGANYGKRKLLDGSEDTTLIAERQRKGLANFRGAFLSRLREVTLFYPEAKQAITPETLGLRLRSCKLHIPTLPKIVRTTGA